MSDISRELKITFRFTRVFAVYYENFHTYYLWCPSMISKAERDMGCCGPTFLPYPQLHILTPSEELPHTGVADKVFLAVLAFS